MFRSRTVLLQAHGSHAWRWDPSSLPSEIPQLPRIRYCAIITAMEGLCYL